ncbi:helix-turn-helix domain-containing protein [Streptomyces sp. NPDC093094]|uniref:helix-turn-helix domain-containing protein n=1 Tax=Streptomyces sp. NPDC093094 TaxID=3366026 RepID=UPI003828A04A
MTKDRQEDPADVSPRDRLAAELRRIKEESQLSFERLAARTNYSRSSLERFLNGKQLPTAVAVEQLAAVTREDPAPLLDLLSRATAQTGASDAVPPGGQAHTVTPPPGEPEVSGTRTEAPPPLGAPRRHGSGWRRRTVVAGYVLGGALAGSLLTGLLMDSSATSGEPDGKGARQSSASSASGEGADDAARVAGDKEPVPPENVKVKCRSDTCLRHDPQAMECQWDATTARETWLRGMHIELRYSRACQAVWGRIEAGTVGDKVIIRDGRAFDLDATIRFEHDTYTKMLAVSKETPLSSISICGVIPRQKQMECVPHAKVSP